MCGIWTYIKLSKNNKNKNLTKKLLDNFWNLKNRGPDNSILQTFGNVTVGFHRLSIMDNSFQSNQPFIFQDNLKTVVFICNGEIYNFMELNKKYGLNINNNSDCMTIPKLYLKHDFNNFLELFNKEIKGEFSFVLLEFDSQKNLRKMIVGRDQIGIRPLYINKFDENSKLNDLIISSEIKGMLDYENTVEEFTPGNLKIFDFDEFYNHQISNYQFKWVYDITNNFSITEENNLKIYEDILLKKLRQAVINSVRRRLKADRNKAFLLSGGVDSSLVCAIASKILKEPINTFCCGMGKGTDLEYAREVAKHINSNHKEVIFTPEAGLEAIPNVIYAIESWDVTTVRASVGQYLVSKYIGENTNCRVVFVGEGPDEVCSSYMFNWNAPNGKELDEAAKELVNEIHYFDCKRSDRCISYFGLEGRVPLLDPEVIEAYWSIPADWRHPKFKGIEKWWLRKAFDDINLLPESVLWRKKEAFSDGVSSKEDSWYSIIQKNIEKYYDTDYKKELDIYEKNKPPTLEAYFYRDVFTKMFGLKRDNIIPHYWQPKWCNNKNGYIDPSARILDSYNDVKKESQIQYN